MAIWTRSEFVTFGSDFSRRVGWFRRAWLLAQKEKRASGASEVVDDSNAGQRFRTPRGNNPQSEELPMNNRGEFLP